MSRDPSTYLWWLLSRTAGITALVAFSAAAALGLWTAAKGLPRRPGAAVASRGLHEQTAVVGLVAVAVHVIALLGDAHLQPAPQDLLVPFALDHAPVWTTCGIVAADAAAILGLSFHARRRIGMARWKAAHRTLPIAYVLVLAHVLGAGSDAGTWWLRALLVACVLPFVAAGTLRLQQGGLLAPAHPGTAAPRR